MASSRAIEAARAFVSVAMDDDELKRGIKRVQMRMRSMAQAVGTVGRGMVAGAAAVAAPLVASAFKFIATGDEIHKMGIRTGVTADYLSQMGFALEQSGGSLKDFGNGLKGMANFLQGAERGLSTSTDTLNDLGISLEDLSGLRPEERFELFADRIAAVEDPTRRAALAMDVFGRAGEALIPLLNEGQGGIAKLRAEADELGRTLTQEQVDAAAAAGDAWNRLKSVFSGVVMQIGAALAPAIQSLSTDIARDAAVIVEWIRENNALIETLAKVAFAAGATGAALIAFSITTNGVASAMNLATVATKGFGLALAFVSKNPLIALATAVAGIVLAMLDWESVLGRVWGYLKDIAGIGDEVEKEVVIAVSNSGADVPDELKNAPWVKEALGEGDSENGLGKRVKDLTQAITSGAMTESVNRRVRPSSTGSRASEDLRSVQGFNNSLTGVINQERLSKEQLKQQKAIADRSEELVALVRDQEGWVIR